MLLSLLWGAAVPMIICRRPEQLVVGQSQHDDLTDGVVR
jgi:hypothetical protein